MVDEHWSTSSLGRVTIPRQVGQHHITAYVFCGQHAGMTHIHRVKNPSTHDDSLITIASRTDIDEQVPGSTGRKRCCSSGCISAALCRLRGFACHMAEQTSKQCLPCESVRVVADVLMGCGFRER